MSPQTFSQLFHFGLFHRALASLFHALLQERKGYFLIPPWLTHSLCKTPGMASGAFSSTLQLLDSSTSSPATPLSATLTKNAGVSSYCGGDCGRPHVHENFPPLPIGSPVPESRASVLTPLPPCFIISPYPATIPRLRCLHPVDSSPREGRFPNEWSFADCQS